jgi:hypothetical protein
LGYLRPPRPRRFRRAQRSSVRCRPPSHCWSGFILLGGLLLLQSAFQLSPARAPRLLDRQTRAPSLGFGPSSRHKCVESTNTELPTARLMFRPQRFSHSRRFTPPHTSWAYFIPQPRPGFTFQGFSLLPSRHASQRAVPSCDCRNSPASVQARWFQILPARLQGIHPSSNPLRYIGGLDLSTARSPLTLSPPRVFLRTPCPCLHRASTHDLRN